MPNQHHDFVWKISPYGRTDKDDMQLGKIRCLLPAVLSADDAFQISQSLKRQKRGTDWLPVCHPHQIPACDRIFLTDVLVEAEDPRLDFLAVATK